MRHNSVSRSNPLGRYERRSRLLPFPPGGNKKATNTSPSFGPPSHTAAPPTAAETFPAPAPVAAMPTVAVSTPGAKSSAVAGNTLSSLSAEFQCQGPMVEICRFFGILIRMFHPDYPIPHVFAEYQGAQAVIGIRDGEVLSGKFPDKQLKLVVAWMILHEDELLLNFDTLRASRSTWEKVEPLR